MLLVLPHTFENENGRIKSDKVLTLKYELQSKSKFCFNIKMCYLENFRFDIVSFLF
jgi:hypothetical protein